MSFRKFIVLIFSFLAAVLPLSAQGTGQTDSVVVLMNAKSLELLEDAAGFQYRKAVDARFLHNNTYLVCDTALWNVNTKIINAFGNVQIIQDRTVLSSEKLDYLIDEDLAQFRGNRVQLLDKDGNTLRTRFLDYNTKDSVAYFQRGASMRDKDGQVIESDSGMYDSKAKLFTFEDNVNMYTDSVYVKTSRLEYHSDYDFAEFLGEIDAWKGKNMLSSRTGTYDKPNDRFFFTGNVHVMSDTQEGWSDSLYYDRPGNNVEMYGNIQVTDTTRKVSALGDILHYVDSLSMVTLEKNASVIAETNENGKIDTVYVGARKFIYHTVPKCDIDGNIVQMASKRLSDLGADPVSEYRRKAAEEAEQASAASAEDDPNDPEAAARRRELYAKNGQNGLQAASDEPSDSTSVQSSEMPEAPSDSPAAEDSLALDDMMMPDEPVEPDTTKIGFLTAVDGVRLFRSDMQVVCDSLEYCDLDSLARLFLSPIVWNEGNRQYTSDSLTIAINGQRMEKASLMSNAFITIQEDSICFDQIKSTEILAYFDSTTALRRFDALGGANALFFLQENDAFATVNKVESKMLSAVFKDGDIERVFYFDNPKNDAYPVVQLPKEDRRLKGFNWQPELRPQGKEDITPLQLRETERARYLAHAMPGFTETERYFPGHMDAIRKKLASQDSVRRVQHADEVRRRNLVEEQEALKVTDSLAALEILEKIAAADSPADSSDTAVVRDADEVIAPADSLTAVADTAAVNEPAPVDEKALRAAEAEARRLEKQEAKEARWAELDARDAAKQAEKDARNLERKRRSTLKKVMAAAKEGAKDMKKYERYVRKFEKRKERKQ